MDHRTFHEHLHWLKRHAAHGLGAIEKAGFDNVLDALIKAHGTIDYKALLAKYIQHVRAEEGVDFVDSMRTTGDVPFTAAEIIAVSALSDDRSVEGSGSAEARVAFATKWSDFGSDILREMRKGDRRYIADFVGASGKIARVYDVPDIAIATFTQEAHAAGVQLREPQAQTGSKSTDDLKEGIDRLLEIEDFRTKWAWCEVTWDRSDACPQTRLGCQRFTFRRDAHLVSIFDVPFEFELAFRVQFEELTAKTGMIVKSDPRTATQLLADLDAKRNEFLEGWSNHAYMATGHFLDHGLTRVIIGYKGFKYAGGSFTVFDVSDAQLDFFLNKLRDLGIEFSTSASGPDTIDTTEKLVLDLVIEENGITFGNPDCEAYTTLGIDLAKEEKALRAAVAQEFSFDTWFASHGTPAVSWAQQMADDIVAWAAKPAQPLVVHLPDVVNVGAETSEGLAAALAPYLNNGYEAVGSPSLGGFCQVVRKSGLAKEVRIGAVEAYNTAIKRFKDTWAPYAHTSSREFGELAPGKLRYRLTVPNPGHDATIIVYDIPDYYGFNIAIDNKALHTATGLSLVSLEAPK